jgi:hypothetical protein
LDLFHYFFFAKEIAIRPSPDARILIKAGLIAIANIQPTVIKHIPKKKENFYNLLPSFFTQI